MGYIFEKNGISIDKNRIAAIEAIVEPSDKKALQRILGLIVFLWLPYHTKVFNRLKKIISNAPVLQNFNPNAAIYIQTDASKDGIGSCLLQNGKPVCV